MALNGSLLVQQKGALEGKIKLLVNADLKEICKAYGYPVSGTKAILQGRCMEILDNHVHGGDAKAFDILRYMLFHHGQKPSAHELNAPPRPTYAPAAVTYPMGSTASRPAPLGTSSRKFFKPSPFYEIIDTVLPLCDLTEMPQNRNTEKRVVTLTEDTVRRLKADAQHRIMLFCGQTASMTAGQADISFPGQIEVRIGGEEVKHNFKGLKGKPGTTKPADITPFIRQQAGYQTPLMFTYALTQRRFAFTLYLVRRVKIEALTEQIRNSKVIPKQTVLDEMSRANADADLAATAIHMSLKDPVSTMRITLPVRSTICAHNQCFDGSMFLQLQEQAPQWQCPICNKQVTFSQLCIDKYFEDILSNTSSSIEKVSVEPNGEWMVIKEEEDESGDASILKSRAPYDEDDFDDDVLELSDTPPPMNDPVKAGLLTAASLPVLPPPTSINPLTPTTASRKYSSAQPQTPNSPPTTNKRPASAVIDLTLSDDDDDPPRPAKRAPTHSFSNGMVSEAGSSLGSQDPFDSRPIHSRHPSFSGTIISSTYPNAVGQGDFLQPPFRMTNSSLGPPNSIPPPPPPPPPPPFGLSITNHPLGDRPAAPRLTLPAYPSHSHPHNHNHNHMNAESDHRRNGHAGYSTSPEPH